MASYVKGPEVFIAAERVLALTPEERQAVGERARKQYMFDTHFFAAWMNELRDLAWAGTVSWLMSIRDIKPAQFAFGYVTTSPNANAANAYKTRNDLTIARPYPTRKVKAADAPPYGDDTNGGLSLVFDKSILLHVIAVPMASCCRWDSRKIKKWEGGRVTTSPRA
uniref:Uncharacterized protein n=1 Tax=Peronospora matthiolae TaxID=2874970 RepID=A0AAV1TRN9_9STRA